jgi:hypothetical protein
MSFVVAAVLGAALVTGAPYYLLALATSGEH